MVDILRYFDFSSEIHKKIKGRRIPIGGAIEVTRRCPLHCIHCYNNLPADDQDAKGCELTYDEHCCIIDEITEAGCLWLLFTGGEIFLRKDFLEIYTHAKKRGLLITLFTNGILVTPEIADYLVEWRPFSIEISLYGSTEETHDRVTGVKGCYKKTMRAIHLLMDRGLPIKLKSMVLTTNKHEIWAMKQLVESEIGLDFRFDAMINPRIDRSQNPLAVRLSPEEAVELDLKDPKRMGEWKKFCEKFNGPVHAGEDEDDLYHCGGGVHSFAIDPYGRLKVCELSSGDGYDLREGSFREGWERHLLNVRKQKITRWTKCTRCEIKAMCGMCPENAQLENKDPEEPVDFMCQVAHLRAKALGIQVKPHGECEYCKK
ncbi:MAG: radical SAM protein [Thermodesulfobacteriota bacterium]